MEYGDGGCGRGRLPTEAEWIWAAMGADTALPGEINTTGYSKAFAGSTGSNNVDDYAWYHFNAGAKIHEGGKKLPNELGLYDMSGNLYEWTYDWYALSYPSGPLTNPTGNVWHSWRVRRGGDFFNAASEGSVANRIAGSPYDPGGGFRVCLSLTQG
ncbi:MAG: formylglycine-generating enzyme family protein [Spirochaetaceae bacterium]|jgi:formylglycine-generating enzyme required for sulfatase activity|nr:formylglycine-generating enzyme family protein [Spirochaetaceae bacterium]